MPAKAVVVKIGGSTLGSHDTTLEDVASLQKEGRQVVVVHGGGKTITEWLERSGVPTRFVRGLRVTDGPSLQVVMAVLGGLVNKELVASLAALGVRAIGMTGIDGRLIECEATDAELGFVGEIKRINLGLLNVILEGGYVPVVAPLGIGPADGKADMPLNINADTVAGEMAAALGAGQLIFLTDVVGVCDAGNNLIPCLTSAETRSLIDFGVISRGMIPKVEACLRAASASAEALIIDGRSSHALLDALHGKAAGTRIS